MFPIVNVYFEQKYLCFQEKGSMPHPSGPVVETPVAAVMKSPHLNRVLGLPLSLTLLSLTVASS